MNLQQINEKRLKNNQLKISLEKLYININGRRFRNDEINIKICNIYEMIGYDLDWRCLEIKDPWRRAKKHMVLLNETFGEKSIDRIRFDHVFTYMHICEIYKWLNRSYQFLKVGGELIATFIDFNYLFKQSVSTEDMFFNQHVETLQTIEKQIFTTSDSTGLYYHQTILTPRRLQEYMKKSFFDNITIEKSYHEVLDCDIYEIKAIKDTDKKLALAPDGTLIENQYISK